MELLKQLYEIYSPSGGEKTLKRFIKKWVARNIPDAIIRTDNNDGNVYIMRGDAETYPCVVAHLDQVQRTHSEDFIAVETDDIIFGYSPKNKRREGLGADDKNGIWVALKCLEEFSVIKTAFFVGEEIGCVGSKRCDIDYFKDCRFIIQPDRRGSSDLITNISGRICSDAFEAALPSVQFGYKATSGLMTDVETLCDRGVGISCINLSCGYFEPHTDDEFTVKDDLYNCLNFVRTAIIDCQDVYPNEYVGYSYGNASYNSVYARDYYDDWYRDCEGSPTINNDGPVIPRVLNYATIEHFIDDLMVQNFQTHYPEEIWPYVASDLETFEVDEMQFLRIAYSYWCFYNGLDEQDYFGYEIENATYENENN